MASTMSRHSPISKFDLLRLIAERYEKTITLVPDDTRGHDRSLVADRFAQATRLRCADLAELVDTDVFDSVWLRRGCDVQRQDCRRSPAEPAPSGRHVLKRFLVDRRARDPHLQPRREETGGNALELNDAKLKFYIGDVRNYDSIHQALKGVHYVFHAAALKQVPSCEFYPLEAVRTNILGAENVMSAAIANASRRSSSCSAPTRRSIRSTPWARPRP